MNGVLCKVWEVHCNRCERPALGLAFNGSKSDAAKELRTEGWKLVNRKWQCWSCD